MLQPVWRHTVVDLAKRLIGPHEAHINFALVSEDGKSYVHNTDPDGPGGLQWDESKWDNWYYRRFLGDHPELSTGNQCLVAAPNAALLALAPPPIFAAATPVAPAALAAMDVLSEDGVREVAMAE
jgi:hypothetical protein